MPSLSQVNAFQSSSLVPCAISDRNQERYKISLYAGMVEAKVQRVRTTPLRSGGGGNKSEITTFSRRSRNNMLKAVAKKRDKSRLMFVTLTFRDDVWIDREFTPQRAKIALQAFMKRIERKYPHVGLLWRMEFQDRKSGKLRGEYLPHFHILIDGIMLDMADVRRDFWQWWHEITTGGDTEAWGRSRVDVQIAANMRQAYYYLSKYVAKEDSAGEESPLQNFFQGMAGEIGRHWGIRGNWNSAPVVVVTVTRQEFIKFRRTIRKWVSKRNKRFAGILQKMSDRVGFSVFGLGDQETGVLDFWDSAVMRLIVFNGSQE